MVKKLALFLCVFIVLPIFGETLIDSSISGLVIGDSEIGGEYNQDILVKGILNIRSGNNRNVKGQLSLNTTVSEKGTLIDIDKAWIRFRFPYFIGTIGKNRITWGDGAAFNAGDVIFDDYLGNNIDLTQEELKSINRLLALGSIPLGLFTFLDLIYLPSNLEFKTHSVGGRFVTNILEHKVEVGYLYNGEFAKHKPYLSFNGTGLINYHLSGNLNITDNASNEWYKGLTITAGVFSPVEIGSSSNLSLRLETQIEPYSNYKYQLYPEIVFSPVSELSFFTKSVIGLDEGKATSTLGALWRTFPGFSLSSFVLWDWSKKINWGLNVTYSF